MDGSCTRRAWLAASGGAALLAGCASLRPPPEPPVDASPWAVQSTGPSASRPWRHQAFPGKAPTQFKYAREDDRHAVSVTASSSASMLRRQLRIEPGDLGSVAFSWKVPALIDNADLASRENDDAPVRVMLVFEGDRSRFSPRDAMMSELMRALTGEEMPYATLIYSWCSRREPGSVVTNARTSRVRTLVVESGPQKLNRWLDYRRNVRADFERAFGEPPGALVGVGIMSDSDNTRSVTRAWYGPLRFLPSPATAR